MRTEPVGDKSAIRRSLASNAPVSRPPITNEKIAGSSPASSQTAAAILVHAMAVKGVFSDGFQITEFPQITARAEFHDQTATGKLNAEIHPPVPTGWQCSNIRC